MNGIGLVCRMEDDTSHAIELSGYVILVTKTKAGKMQLLGKSLSVTIVFQWVYGQNPSRKNPRTTPPRTKPLGVLFVPEGFRPRGVLS